jgi:hypothetical protein
MHYHPIPQRYVACSPSTTAGAPSMTAIPPTTRFLSNWLICWFRVASDRLFSSGLTRSGILAMLLSGARPTATAGVVLNDICPVIETKGLMRINGKCLSHEPDAQFSKPADADWLAAAKRAWREDKQGPGSDLRR